MSSFAPLAARDLLVTALTVGLVVLDARAALDGAGGVALGVAAGVLVALTSFLLHEWGHWLGAVSSGARVTRPPRVLSPFLFHFDTGTSTRAQFLAMSIGGYLATVVALAALLAWADVGRASGLTALVLAGLGALVTAALEIPTTIRVLRGAPLPTGGVYETTR